MTENPELRAKILDWQRRYNIQDGDPAIAFLELVEMFGSAPRGGSSSISGGSVTAAKVDVSSDALSDAMKSALLPVTERVSYQAQELQEKLQHIDFEKFVQQIQSYHEGIDYCTKKLDVVKKEVDGLVVKLEKAAGQISPVSWGAIVTLMAGAAIVGAVVAKLWL